MNDRSNAMGCVMGCWLAALAAGILLAIMLMMFGGFSFTPAAFFGLLAFVLGGAFLSWAICKGDSSSAALGAGAAGAGVAAASAASASSASTGSASASADAGVAAADAGAATATAAPLASSDATVKSGTTLDGEEELAARKGDWKYEGEAEKPAKKPAAKKPAAKKAPAKKAPAKAAAKPVAKDGKPELLKKARAGGPDDLKQIKGVGPKLEGMLHTMGVFHFDQVASWRKKEVEWVDDNLEGFKGRVSRDEWVKQAKILAKGGSTEFSKKVDKGGVY